MEEDRSAAEVDVDFEEYGRRKPPPPPKPLSVKEKLAYGLGDLTAAAPGVTSFFINSFLLDVVGLKPYLAGITILVSKLWDAVSDPTVGVLSDMTTSKLGRRRPWLFYCSIPFGLSFFLLWQTPSFLSFFEAQWFKALYYLAALIFFNTMYTCVEIPYAALTAEITDQYDQRTSLTTYRMFCYMISNIVGIFLHSNTVTLFKTASGRIDRRKGYAASGLILGVLCAIPKFITAAYIKEKPQYGKRKASSSARYQSVATKLKNWLSDMRNAFSRAFICVIMIETLSWTTLNLVQSIIVILMRHYFDAEGQTSFVILAVEICVVVSLVPWKWVSGKYGKKATYQVGILLWTVSSLALFFLPSTQVFWLYVLSPLIGFGFGVALLIPASMVGDVVEYDEIRTGLRREGLFFSLFIFFEKCAVSLALSLSNFILGLAGYISSEDVDADDTKQPYSAILAARIMISFVAAFFLLASMIPCYFYPITRESHAKMLEELRERNLLEERVELDDEDNDEDLPDRTLGFDDEVELSAVSVSEVQERGDSVPEDGNDRDSLL